MAGEFPEFDIFRLDNDGTVIWLEPAMVLSDAPTYSNNSAQQFREIASSSARRPPTKLSFRLGQGRKQSTHTVHRRGGKIQRSFTICRSVTVALWLSPKSI